MNSAAELIVSDESLDIAEHKRYEEFLPHFLRDQSRVFAYVRALLPHYADAQDVFQRCSLTLWRNFDHLVDGLLFHGIGEMRPKMPSFESSLASGVFFAILSPCVAGTEVRADRKQYRISR